MLSLSQPTPPFGPPRSNEERLSRLRHLVKVAARNAQVRAFDHLLFAGLLTMFAWALELTAFLFVIHSPTLASWFSACGIAFFVVNLVYAPALKARHEGVTEGRMLQFLSVLDDLPGPLNDIEIAYRERLFDRLRDL